MLKTAHNRSPGHSRKGILILLCALAPIAIGLLMPDRKNESESPAGSQSPTEARLLNVPDEPDQMQSSGSGLEFARFDARTRAKQRDALRDLKASNPQEAWSEFFKRHKDGDKTAFDEFPATITPENAIAAWEFARNAKLSKDDKSRFYQTLGMVGGGDIVNQLIDLSDRDASLAVAGWAEANPSAALDWYRQLDIKVDPRMRDYLASSNLMPEGFLDRVSDSLLNSMNPAPNAPDSADSGAAFVNEAVQLVESLMAEDPRKGEAMMRELTERFIDFYDNDAVADWFNQLDSPDVQSAAIQRIIESGAFKDDPFQAVDVAFSMDDPKTRGNAISAAYGQLGSGVGGVDPGAVAEQIQAMPVGRDRDFAINGWAHGVAGNNPDLALQMAGTISDDGFRETVTRNINTRIEAGLGEVGGRRSED